MCNVNVLSLMLLILHITTVLVKQARSAEQGVTSQFLTLTLFTLVLDNRNTLDVLGSNSISPFRSTGHRAVGAP